MALFRSGRNRGIAPKPPYTDPYGREFSSYYHYANHARSEAKAGRRLNPENRDLVNHFGKHYKAPERSYIAQGEERSPFTGRSDTSPTFLGNPRSSLPGDNPMGYFLGANEFMGNHPSSQSPPRQNFSQTSSPYVPSQLPSAPTFQSYANSSPGSLDSYGSMGGNYLSGAGQPVPPSMQGIMSLAQSVVANSAQGMADGGHVRTKIGSGGFRKGGPMERMVSEMSNYSSGRR